MRKWKPEDTPNFASSEFACKCGNCGGIAKMDADFMQKLQQMRDLLGRPMSIVSGFRCPDHPEEKKKSKPGAHSLGLAADISVSGGEERDRILELAYNVGMQGKGVANTFIHVDNGHPHAPRPTLWKY